MRPAIHSKYYAASKRHLTVAERWVKAMKVGDWVFPANSLTSSSDMHEGVFAQVLVDGVFTEDELERLVEIDEVQFGWADPQGNFREGGTLGSYERIRI